MSNKKVPNKTISNIVRKLLKSKGISIKRAANYINCTEQSFRNKLSRDSFSLKDLIILCHVCDAKLMMDYCAYTDDFDMDFFELSDYLNNEEIERIHELDKQYTLEDFSKWAVSFTKTTTPEEFSKMSNEEIGELVKKQFNGRIELIDKKSEEPQN